MNRPSHSDKGADMTRDRRVRMLTQTKGQTDMNFKKTLLAAALTLSAGFAMAADLPQVAILATGGTIAGTAASATQTTGYKAGDLAIQTLIDAVPQIKDYATVTGEQIVKISSNNLTDQVLLTLARRCNELLADPKVSGIVITHGTDTLEETAFFLNLTVKSKKPVVVIGAMRPATAISADGPMNLLNAVKLAADPKAQDRGVLVALNDQISSGRDVTKSNTTNVATFKSPDLGYLGYIAGGKNYFLRNPAMRHTHQSEFDVSKLDKLPRVDILYTHASDDRVLSPRVPRASCTPVPAMVPFTARPSPRLPKPSRRASPWCSPRARAPAWSARTWSSTTRPASLKAARSIPRRPVSFSSSL